MRNSRSAVDIHHCGVCDCQMATNKAMYEFAPIILPISEHLCLDSVEIQDLKMEVLYHVRSYFVGIFPYIALT